MKNNTLILLLTASPIFAGAPTPVPASQYNTEQGFTLGIEPMALAPYSSSSWDKNDYTFAGRGSLGYQFTDGLFVTATYFGYGGDLTDHTAITASQLDHYSGRMSASYMDLVVGQNFKPTDTLKLSPYVGMRWAVGQQGYTDFSTSPYPVVGGTTTVPSFASRDDFKGLGIVLGVDATRALGNSFSIYGTAKESVVFGSGKYATTTSPESSSDTVVSISELGLGLQYDFSFSGITSNIRLGVEGQWWALSTFSSSNVGLAGFVMGANFRF